MSMSKIQSLTAHQRLRQLVNRQLGQGWSVRQAASGATDGSAAQPAVSLNPSQIHQQLAARAGILSQTPQATDTLAERAQRRLQMNLERQQYNLERIMALAAEYCSDQPVTQDVDPDWFHQYCQLVQDISSAPMQRLWARILAEEIRQPGRFSNSTLQILRKMHVKDAQALQSASSLVCRPGRDDSALLCFGYSQRGSFLQFLRGRHRGMLSLSQFGLTYPQILSLTDLGLIHPAEIESGEYRKQQQLQLQFNGHQLQGYIRYNGIVLHYYKLTYSGVELVNLVSQPHNVLYVQALHTLLAPVTSFP